MIEQLTPEQELKVSECRDKWLNKGFSISPINEVEISGAVDDLYSLVLGRKSQKVPVIFTKGPFEAWICTVLAHMVISGVRDSSLTLHKEMFIGREYMPFIDSTSIERDGRLFIDRILGRSVRVFTDASISISSVVYDKEIRSALYNGESKEYSDRLDGLIKHCMEIISPHIKLANDFPISVFIEEVRRYILSFSFASNGIGQFQIEELVTSEIADILNLSRSICRSDPASYKTCKDRSTIMQVMGRLVSCGFMFPLRKISLVCERPTVFGVKDNRLHCSSGPAIRFNDGVEVWALNGVSVPPYLVTTPAEKLDPLQLTKIQNVEIRREFVNKVGVERICNELKAEIIQSGIDHNGMPCDLLLLDVGDERKRPYIKLKNPSVPGIYHIEGVHPHCRTLEDVWKFRNGSDEKPIILT